MATTEAVTHVSLCAGYGGIDLGLKRAIPSLRTIAFSEIEAFACANLVAKMEAGQLDPAPVWTNLKTFPWSSFRGKVGVLSGGYPCQPFSAAGKRLGADDPRHLWPFIADGIAAMRPAICFFENVEGHISLGLEQVIRDLQGLGYRCTFGVFSASEVGAPHQRKRVFILAHDQSIGIQGHGTGWLQESFAHAGEGLSVRGGYCWPSRPGQQQFPWEPPRVVANTRGQEPAWLPQTEGRDERAKAGIAGAGVISIWQTQSTLGRDADGPAGRLDYAQLCVAGNSRVDELRLLGNGVVPATAERAFNVLASRLFS